MPDINPKDLYTRPIISSSGPNFLLFEYKTTIEQSSPGSRWDAFHYEPQQRFSQCSPDSTAGNLIHFDEISTLLR